MSADLALPVAGRWSLLIQALHPLAMADADQHSSWHRDPVGTLAVTMAYHPHSNLRRPGSGHASLGMGTAHPGSYPWHGRGYWLPVRGGRSRSPALVHGALVDSVLAAGTLVGTAAG